MEEEYEFLYKVVIVGDSFVGKTNLLFRFINEDFAGDSKPTIGIEYYSKIIQAGSTQIKVQLWDTTGVERYCSVSKLYYRNAVGALVVFDVTSRESFDAAPRWLKEVRENSEEDLRVLLVGNKRDLRDRR